MDYPREKDGTHTMCLGASFWCSSSESTWACVETNRSRSSTCLRVRRSGNGLGSKRAVMANGQEMPSETKQIVNRTVDHEKMLGLARRFEATHVTLSLASPLMRDPGAVV